MSIPKQDERTPGLEAERLPGGYTLSEWQDLARRDDCLKRMVQSDLRQLLGIIERQRKALNSFNSLREALAAIIECDDARDVFESFGLADSTDNDGQPYPSKHLADILDRARAALNGVTEPATWRSMDTAQKDGRSVLGLFKKDFTSPHNDTAVERWGGTQIVMRHPGLAHDGFDVGWNLTNGGCGGFPDEWFEGWMPLPRAPDAARTALAGVTAPVEEQ